MNHVLLHTMFDLLAVALALPCGWLVYNWRFKDALLKTASSIGGGYFVSLSLGSITGAYLFGTLTLYMSGIHEIGRSIVGAFAGAIMMVEFYKARRGTDGSTGYIYVVPFCVCVVIGRIGCFLGGIEDRTAGIETTLPWGYDFGDHVLRHPVQLYESLSMLVFMSGFLLVLRKHAPVAVKYGFYACAFFYGAERFVWEFLKPYAKMAFGLNLFQYLCIGLMLYGAGMVMRARHARHARTGSSSGSSTA